MGKLAKLNLPDQEIELPIVIGTEDEKGLDISKFRSGTGHVTLDPGYMNTGNRRSPTSMGTRGSCAIVGFLWKSSRNIPRL